MGQSWVRNNAFIIAALALPVVVIAFFLAATAIPRLLVDDPQYDLLFALNRYDAHGGEIGLRYRVENDRLLADASLVPAHDTFLQQRLYRFDAQTQRVSEVRTQVPEAARLTLAERAESQTTVRPPPGQPRALPSQPPPHYPQVTFEVGMTERARILPGDTAPDGYVFRNETGSGGIVGELFGMGRYGGAPSIARRGRVIALETGQVTGRPYYGQLELIGWIDRE